MSSGPYLRMSSSDEAWALLRRRVRVADPRPEEEVAACEAAGRDGAAMDGFAVRAAERLAGYDASRSGTIAAEAG